MIELNINDNDGDPNNPVIWAGDENDENGIMGGNDGGHIELSPPESDLFDLARVISVRGTSRRRLRRSSSII